MNLSAQGFYKVPAGRCGYDFSVEASKDRGTPYNYFTQVRPFGHWVKAKVKKAVVTIKEKKGK